MRDIHKASLLATLLMACGGARAADAVDATTINRIADEGYNRGQVVRLAAHLTDNIGGRMTNSPAMRQAEKWTQQMFNSWGLENVHLEGYDFGRGWWIESSSVRMIEPRPLALTAIPVAWTPPTRGTISAPIVVAPVRHLRDLDRYKGKVRGKIVLVSYPEAPKDDTTASFKRYDEAELGKLSRYDQPHFDPDQSFDMYRKYFEQAREIDRFMAAEGALALVKMSYRGGGLLQGEGYFHRKGETLALPEVEMAAEDYRRLARLAKVGEVRLAMNNNVHFEDGDLNAYNVLAEIPGSDPRAGYVMAGAHLDSWVAGDGAADNGAGSAVVMEAARILSQLGVKPKRTIRFALWSGEEQGLLGSLAYVQKHIATRPRPTDAAHAQLPEFMWETYPVTPLPGYQDMKAYFNLDNGSGKIRGIYAEGNFAAMPVLRNWLAPFSSLGADKVVAKKTGGTDHEIMAAMGLPAFQFIQDPLDYGSRVHHSNLDTFDHLRTEDLRQAAVIMATVLLQAADSDTPIPRNVLPQLPLPTDPFHYRDPAKE